MTRLSDLSRQKYDSANSEHILLTDVNVCRFQPQNRKRPFSSCYYCIIQYLGTAFIWNGVESYFTSTYIKQGSSKSFCFLLMFTSEVGVVQKWTLFTQNALEATILKMQTAQYIIFRSIYISILFLQSLTVYRWTILFLDLS